MEYNQEQYICQNCGSSLLKSNKFLHDLKCKPSINNNSINFKNRNLNEENKNNYIDFDNNKNNIFFDLNLFDSYTCEICKAKMNFNEKADHLLCHELEQDEKNKVLNEINLEKNLNNSDLSDPDSEKPNLHFHDINNIKSNNLNRDRDADSSFDLNNNKSINGSRNNNYEEDIQDEESFHDNRRGSSEFIDDEEIDSLDNEFMSDIDAIDDNIIQSFPISKIKDINKLSEEKKRCSICLENYKNGDDSIVLPCIHIFHAECIKTWMKKKNACPICKNKINSENDNFPLLNEEI